MIQFLESPINTENHQFGKLSFENGANRKTYCAIDIAKYSYQIRIWTLLSNSKQRTVTVVRPILELG